MYIDIHTHHSQCRNICIQNIVIENKMPIFINQNNYYSAGIHPWYLPENVNESLYILRKTLQSKKIIAIGEIGLDFHPNIIKKNSKKQQIEIFKQQIALGDKLQKPLIIHCVKAWDILLELKNKNKNKIPWIIHGFNKNKELAKQLIKAGFYLSFGANIITNSVNAEAIQTIPLNKIFLETDNQTIYDIKTIYTKASNLLNISKETLTQELIHNFSIFQKI